MRYSSGLNLNDLPLILRCIFAYPFLFCFQQRKSNSQFEELSRFDIKNKVPEVLFHVFFFALKVCIRTNVDILS